MFVLKVVNHELNGVQSSIGRYKYICYYFNNIYVHGWINIYIFQFKGWITADYNYRNLKRKSILPPFMVFCRADITWLDWTIQFTHNRRWIIFVLFFNPARKFKKNKKKLNKCGHYASSRVFSFYLFLFLFSLSSWFWWVQKKTVTKSWLANLVYRRNPNNQMRFVFENHFVKRLNSKFKPYMKNLQFYMYLILGLYVFAE